MLFYKSVIDFVIRVTSIAFYCIHIRCGNYDVAGFSIQSVSTQRGDNYLRIGVVDCEKWRHVVESGHVKRLRPASRRRVELTHNNNRHGLSFTNRHKR
jgi:hypothetical protein